MLRVSDRTHDGFRREANAAVTLEPDPGNGLEAVSAAQCQHIRAIASRAVERLADPIGNVGPQAHSQTREILADLLDL